jgi:hypothetical protein
MKKAKLEGNGGLEESAANVEDVEAAMSEPETAENADRSELVATVATVAAPQYFPKMGEALNPLFRSTVRGAYKLGNKTREFVAEAQEQVHDIVAEVHAEDSMQETKAAAA